MTDTHPAALTELRQQIDELDDAVIALLAQRFQATDQVGHLKVEHQLAAQDTGREAAQRARLSALARAHNLPVEIAEDYLALIVGHVVQRHRKLGAG